MNLRSKQKELADLLAQMSVLSEVSAVNLDPGSKDGSENDVGGNRPPGGIDRKADREPEFLLKSHSHYVRRARSCRSESDLDAVIGDVRKTLKAWKRPAYSTEDGREPKPGEAFFVRRVERVVAENEKKPDGQRKTDQQLAWDLDCSRQLVNRVRLELERAAA